MAWRWLYRVLGKDMRSLTAHPFTDEERDKSHIARLNNQIRKQRIDYLKEKLQRMKQLQEEEMLEEQVQELERDFYADDDENDTIEQADITNPDALVSSLLLRVLSGNQQPAASARPTLQRTNLDDTQIRSYKSQIPDAILKKAKKMNDEELLQLVRSYNPSILEQYDDDTIARAMKILKE